MEERDPCRIFSPATMVQKQELRASVEAVVVVDEFKNVIDGHDSLPQPF